MSRLSQKLRELKYNYLNSQGPEGGYSQDFQDSYVAAWAEKPENMQFVRDNLLDAVKEMARKAWGEKLPHPPLSQGSFMLGGDPVPVEIKYKDRRPEGSRVPGGYITVLMEHASVDQLFGHWEVVQGNANKQVIAAQKIYEMYELALERAGGNTGARIADLFDEEIPDA